ncbi:methyl-accepting chemotaxis protein [Paludicola sp. MB14-C6]|uniref:methyl-accepting chemotaxis protein n=1 Tax=Paludihabitans sp. MB14-C6 TaxID=3070656 RepID=UPI0027DE6194|nr:methyl-accepting chemotaxis protein [Paludicola sp. MB14-C6]WMJ23933.1 methyl-accepting chemotaxis protein [Paludicola sp. MB14-C6]
MKRFNTSKSDDSKTKYDDVQAMEVNSGLDNDSIDSTSAQQVVDEIECVDTSKTENIEVVDLGSEMDVQQENLVTEEKEKPVSKIIQKLKSKAPKHTADNSDKSKSFKNIFKNLIKKFKEIELKGLGSKLILTIVPCLAIALIICVSIVYTALTALLKKSYITECHQSIGAIEKVIEGYKTTTASTAKDIGVDSIIRDGIIAKDDPALTMRGTTYFSKIGCDNIIFTDEKGIVLTSIGDSRVKEDYGKIGIFASALKGTSITSIEKNQAIQFSVMSSAPIKDAGGKVIGSVLISYNLRKPQIVDDLKMITGNEFTLFFGDTRYNTTLEKDGSRQNNTKANADIINTVLKNGKTYEKEIDILGQNFHTIYKPILGNDKAPIGMIFTGLNIEAIQAGQAKALMASIIVALLLFVISAVFVYFIVNLIITRPLKKLVTVANDIENGEIGIGNNNGNFKVMKTKDEVGQLSRALGNTVEGLKRYIGEISIVLSAIGNGDLTVQSEIEYKGDFIAIKEALDNIVVSLQTTLLGISQAADQVNSGATQVAGGSQALSQGATEQASAIEELSAVISEIAVRIKKNAENAKQATTIADEAGNGIITSNNEMKQMVTAMDDINKASIKISKIIKTIDDIAFQTNILALNAAVEAARAGAAGKGFAVVAEEVRNLASKSAEAANQTSALIESSVLAVKNGTKIANNTAKSLSEVVEKTKKAIDLMDDISTESNEQATAVNQVTSGVDQIAAVVQTNSATAEQSAAASEELSSQSELLHELINRFKVNE